MTTKRARRQRSRGAAVIEMTLFLPLLMLLVFGMIDYGYYFYVSMTANEAARVALRTASSTTTGRVRRPLDRRRDRRQDRPQGLHDHDRHGLAGEPDLDRRVR